MKKFTKLNHKKKEKEKTILFKNDYITIYNYEDWSFISDKRGVFCIPYLVEKNQFIVREEYIPSFKFADGQSYHLSLVGGGVEEGESPTEALFREIEEEAGLLIRKEYNLLEDLGPLYVSKGNSNKIYFYILPLYEIDYDEITARGDGSKAEEMSKSVKIDISNIDRLIASDLPTTYMLLKFKEYLNMQIN